MRGQGIAARTRRPRGSGIERLGYATGMDEERYPSPEERMPDAPTGDPERLERERESQEEPDTKYEQLRDEQEADRAAIADELADDVPSPRDAD